MQKTRSPNNLESNKATLKLKKLNAKEFKEDKIGNSNIIKDFYKNNHLVNYGYDVDQMELVNFEKVIFRHPPVSYTSKTNYLLPLVNQKNSALKYSKTDDIYKDKDNLLDKEEVNVNKNFKSYGVQNPLLMIKNNFCEEVEIKTEDTNSDDFCEDNDFIIDRSLFYLIVSLKDKHGNVISKNSIKSEVTEAKTFNLEPFIISLNTSGQRDIGSLLLEKVVDHIYSSKPLNLINQKCLKIYPCLEDETVEDPYSNLDFASLDKFFRKLYKKFNIDFSTILIAFLYLERVNDIPEFKLTFRNFKRIFLGCLINAYKYNQSEDIIIHKYKKTANSNKSFYRKLADFINIEPSSLNQICEVVLISLLKFDLYFSKNDYRAFSFFAINKALQKHEGLKEIKDKIINKTISLQKDKSLCK